VYERGHVGGLRFEDVRGIGGVWDEIASPSVQLVLTLITTSGAYFWREFIVERDLHRTLLECRG
jgi:hypothetical protein